MVFFTCNSCGSSLKKNAVEKHNFQCRISQGLSCMDCNKEFWENDYKKHTSCITENEKYGAVGEIQKEFKGKKKQEEWIQKLHSYLANAKDIEPKLRSVLENICSQNNVPRKRAKFENFVYNTLKVSNHIVQQAWDHFENALSYQDPNTQKNSEVLKNISNGIKNEKPLSEKKESNTTEIPSTNSEQVENSKKTKNDKDSNLSEGENVGNDLNKPKTKENKLKKKKKSKEESCVEVLEDEESKSKDVTTDIVSSKKRKFDSKNMEVEDVHEINTLKKKKNKKQKRAKNANEETTTNGFRAEDSSGKLESTEEVHINKKRKSEDADDVPKKKKKSEIEESKKLANGGDCENRKIETLPVNGTKQDKIKGSQEEVLDQSLNDTGNLKSSEFKWKSSIKNALKETPERKMKIKKLEKIVIKEYLSSVGEGENDDAKNLFNLKISSSGKFVIEGKFIKLQ